jgi:hypothetical protein
MQSGLVQSQRGIVPNAAQILPICNLSCVSSAKMGTRYAVSDSGKAYIYGKNGAFRMIWLRGMYRFCVVTQAKVRGPFAWYEFSNE